MSYSQIAISTNCVSKLFKRQNQRTFKEVIPAFLGGKKVIDSFWALKNISFDVLKGESIGIIGPNGSGKSTLLKLIAGVTRPTNGSLEINGRIAPLIELGAGLHPELTGRENIYLNGVILGLTRRQLKEKFNDIVNFADLWAFIDQPIKHYSSGMYLRLAFAVAVHVEPEILLIDEILAVGDVTFQKKCFKKMEEFKKNGVTIIYVGHSLELVKKFCSKVLYINQGRMITYDDSEKAIKQYLDGLK